MTQNVDIKSVIENNTLSLEVADKYLRLYTANIDWLPHIATLWNNSVKKINDQHLAKEHVKKAVACTILLPFIEKTQIPDPPNNLLFWCTGWKQFSEKDWFSLFVEILKEDILISNKRDKILGIGIIDPINISPLTRQAFNWMHERVLEEGLSQPDLSIVSEKFKNIVRAYGGAVICNIFQKYPKYVDDVVNWRSGYFFEKQIHKVYSVDQVLKIKQAEINKTNSNFVKKIGG